MGIPAAKDTTAHIRKRIENSNNGYTFTYDRNAMEATLNIGGYSARPHKDFDGELYWTVSKKNY